MADYSVNFVDGNYFKLTISSDGDVRVEVPKNKKEFAVEWNTRCENIVKRHFHIPPTKTLRGKVCSIDEPIHMYTDGNRNDAVVVFTPGSKIDVPSPLTTPPEMDASYWVIDPYLEEGYVESFWGGYPSEYVALKNGLCFGSEDIAKLFISTTRSLTCT